MKLQNYAMGEWVEGNGRVADLVNAVTGEKIAEASSGGLDFKGMIEYAKRVGGPTLRAMTFHQRAAMLKAMPPDHRAVPEATVGFDKVWRWHPRDNEELIIGRWRGTRRAGKPWHELAVFKVCGNVPGLVARMRGPVEVLDKPGAGSDPQKVSAQVSTGTDRGDVKLTYSYGTVTVEQPAFVKAGSSLAEETPDAGADAPPTRRPVIKLPRKK